MSVRDITESVVALFCALFLIAALLFMSELMYWKRVADNAVPEVAATQPVFAQAKTVR